MAVSAYLGKADAWKSLDFGGIAVTLYRMDETTLKDFYNEAMKSPFIVDHFEDTVIKGHIDVPQGGGLLFTTIASEEGWEMYLDGEKVPYETLKKAYAEKPPAFWSLGHHPDYYCDLCKLY